MMVKNLEKMITKEQLDKYIVENMSYIRERTMQIASHSPFPIIRNNDCTDVISEVYFILSKPKNLEKMNNVQHLRGLVNNTLVLLLRKRNSKYIRMMQNDKLETTNIDDEYHICNKEEDIDEQDMLNKQNYDYAVQCWLTLGTPSDKKLYELYFIKGYKSVRLLAKHLGISTYASHKLITDMKNVISIIATGGEYNFKKRHNYEG